MNDIQNDSKGEIVMYQPDETIRLEVKLEEILCRGTEEGRKIYKHLQMKLPSKIKYTNICKDVFPVLCIFTFVNTDSCTFLYSL